MSKLASKFLGKYAARVEAERRRTRKERIERLTASRPYMASIRECVSSAGLSPSGALVLARADAPSRADMHAYMLHRISVNYASALELSVVMTRTENPWEFDQLLFLLMMMDGDAFCCADELQHLRAPNVTVN